jgi:adenine-specific DNA-methyltransferase
MPKLQFKYKNEKSDIKEIYSQQPENFHLLESNTNPFICESVSLKKLEDSPIIIPKTSSSGVNVWKNLLFFGDNLEIMTYLCRDFRNKLDLIYIDPPFATGGNFKLKTLIGEKNDFEVVNAYSDSWKGGIDEYLQFLYERLKLMEILLKESGSIYIHLDWHVSHYVKLLMDEIFGIDNFRNEIIWFYPASSAQTRRFFMRSFDAILFYTKSDDYTFNDVPEIYMEYSNRVKNNLKKDEKGTYYFRGGSHDGKKLSQKVYIGENGIFPRDVWNDIPFIRANTLEYQGFSTQKPERLLKRIILASTNENDIVADFFCGTGTTLSVAEKLNRRWIGTDSTKIAINLSRKRILNISNSNDIYDWKKKYEFNPLPFELISNLGNNNLVNTAVNLFGEIERKNSIDNSDISINITIRKKEIQVELEDYKILNSEIIDLKLRNKIKLFADWVDNWSIDFNYNNEYFNTHWISFRTPKQRKLKLISHQFQYEDSGRYKIAIKIVNIFSDILIKQYEINIE